MKELKPEFEDLLSEFNTHYADIGCTCFISPPCDHCLHNGNPANLEETPEAWQEVQPIVESIIPTKGFLHYVLYGAIIEGDRMFHLTLGAYSVRLALGAT